MKVATPHPTHPKIKAKRLYRVPCRVFSNNSRMCATVLRAEFTIIAESAAAAANWIRDRLCFLPETEIWAWGPKGGEAYRYVGWESAIGSELIHHLTDEEKRERIAEIFGDEARTTNTNLL
jgi:hypothetical protein